MKIECIISFTTHSIRTKNIMRTLTNVLNKENVKIILNIFAEDYKYLTPEIFNLIFSGKIELFVSPIDLGPHLKYFFTGTRYKDIPIIVIDDDIIYPDYFIDELLTYHKKYPNCILSRRPEKIQFDGNKFVHYHLWLRPYFKDEPVFDSLPTGVGGILFPENFFKLTHDNINELLLKCKFDDDVYLKILSLRQNVKIKSVKSANMYKKILDDAETQSIALCNSNWNRTINSFLNFPKEITQLRSLIS